MNKTPAVLVAAADAAERKQQELASRSVELAEEARKIGLAAIHAKQEAYHAGRQVTEEMAAAVKECGEELFLDRDYAPFAAKVFEQIQKAKGIINPVARAFSKAAYAASGMYVSLEGTDKVDIMIFKNNLFSPVRFADSLNFITTFYENYLTDHNPDALLTIRFYEDESDYNEHPFTAVFHQAEGGWIASGQADKEIYPLHATPGDLRSSIEMALREVM